uniref:Helicase ATP-binding domain-containing protein n=1 Tax=Daucus carota subsp. sativus TaxID=79200 RepID=A0A175YPW2_DAUCS
MAVKGPCNFVISPILLKFALQHGGRVLLADEMGLGKTLQAIAVTTCVRDSWPVLVLTPSSLRLHWASMIQQWLNLPSSDILVVIADESHFLKNAQAKRTSAALPILKKAQYAILLTGTPALSRPIELHKQLEALYPDVYKNVHEYGNRYCKGGVFGLYQGASNHEELHNLNKATVMIRRLKKDVLTELPMKRRQQVFLDLSEKDMRQINALFREVIIFMFLYRFLKHLLCSWLMFLYMYNVCNII